MFVSRVSCLYTDSYKLLAGYVTRVVKLVYNCGTCRYEAHDLIGTNNNMNQLMGKLKQNNNYFLSYNLTNCLTRKFINQVISDMSH